MALDTLFHIIENLINYPYADENRIIDLNYYKSKIFKFPPAIDLLKEIGFIEGSSSNSLVFPYSQTFPKLLVAKEILTSRVIKKIQE